MAASGPAPTYIFEARLAAPERGPIDGDTFAALVRLGFRTVVEVHVRLLGINCPELDRPEGEVARAAAADWLQAAGGWVGNGWPLVVDSVRFAPDDKYGGRADCRVYRKLDGRELGADLLAAGQAVQTKG